jgi:hypothetical protein
MMLPRRTPKHRRWAHLGLVGYRPLAVLPSSRAFFVATANVGMGVNGGARSELTRLPAVCRQTKALPDNAHGWSVRNVRSAAMTSPARAGPAAGFYLPSGAYTCL